MSLGGPNKSWNLQTLCVYCNRFKADKLILNFRKLQMKYDDLSDTRRKRVSNLLETIQTFKPGELIRKRVTRTSNQWWKYNPERESGYRDTKLNEQACKDAQECGAIKLDHFESSDVWHVFTISVIGKAILTSTRSRYQSKR